jgi:hypothetical protein
MRKPNYDDYMDKSAIDDRIQEMAATLSDAMFLLWNQKFPEETAESFVDMPDVAEWMMNTYPQELTDDDMMFFREHFEEISSLAMELTMENARKRE